MSVDLSQYFKVFLDNIALGEPQIGRMDSAADIVSEFLTAAYSIPQANVFLQGSYANHTAVEPVEGGEYDIDIAAVCVGPNVSSDNALNQLESLFKADGRFKDRVKTKKPCVRLQYANDEVGSFHVDVVPVRMISESAQLEAPRRGEGWKPTAPYEYTNWCEQQGPLFVRTVMAMKRWRDEQQTVRTAVKSIVLQVLTSQHMPRIEDDALRLSETFKSMYQSLKGLNAPPTVLNPVLSSENLTKNWTTESFKSFVKELDEAVVWSQVANEGMNEVEAADAWRELLGDDFPIKKPNELGIQLFDFSHAETPGQKGWSENLDPNYRVEVTATLLRGRGGQRAKPLLDDGTVILTDRKIHFRANIKAAPRHVEIWWQVANTGPHAQSDTGGLRGEIFKGKDLDSKKIDEGENWEGTKYHGTHLIRVMLVRDSNVVACSDWFQVNIYAKG